MQHPQVRLQAQADEGAVGPGPRCRGPAQVGQARLPTTDEANARKTLGGSSSESATPPATERAITDVVAHGGRETEL